MGAVVRATAVLSSTIMAVLAAGCGSSGSSSSSTPATQQPAATATTPQSTTSTPVGALSAEAQSAATGDIPDTQVFLTYKNPSAGYRISYPEGWTRQGSTADVTFSDKNNIVHIVITKARSATTADVAAELNRLKQSSSTLTFTAPKNIQVKSGSAVKTTYTTKSAPNPVTGKSVLLIVDRYELSQNGKRATVDLGTPKGVDNVDAYRMMINSFRWL
jgi:hypothetical protein